MISLLLPSTLLLSTAFAQAQPGLSDPIPPDWRVQGDVQTASVAEILAAPSLASGPGMSDTLHVLGFSPDGKVALYTDIADEAVGGYLWSFALRDLGSDRDLVALRWSDEELGYVRTVYDVRGQYGPVIQAALKEHGVLLDNTLAVQTLPWTWGGHSYDVRFEALPFDEGDYARRAQVYVTASGLGEKRVGTVQWVDLGHCCGQPQAVLVKSPHEDRIALVVRAWSRGWEGPPHVLRHTVLGVHLTERFEAKER